LASGSTASSRRTSTPRFEHSGERVGVAVEALDAADDLFDLLARDVLELHAGQRIHEHRAELAAARGDRREDGRSRAVRFS
jgi:hypothetical protein